MNYAQSPTWALRRCPPVSFFLVSALFHYLGPSFAVLLFAHVDIPGVAWLRISSAAAVFALWRRPWRTALHLDRSSRWLIVQLGVVLAAMNLCFYAAVAQLPLSTVGAIEFLGTVILAALGTRTSRNVVALCLTVVGVVTITQVRFHGNPGAFAFAFANCALFLLYLILGHRVANAAEHHHGAARSDGIDRLGAAMLVATVVITPIGLRGALPTFTHPLLLISGIVVGVCSSVIPYVTDQLAMSRLPRATFALMLALLPVFSTVIGAIVLHQIPTTADILGIVLVATGVAIHQQESK